MAANSDELARQIKPDMLDGLARLDGRDKLDQSTYTAMRDAAAKSLTDAVDAGLTRDASVTKSISPDFISNMNAMGLGGIAASLQKDISATSPLNTTISQTFGFMPFDLSAPAKLLYPVKAPLRQKLPRTRGQGPARMTKRVTGISGSGTAGNTLLNPFTTELPNAETMAGNWPMNDMNAMALTADMLVVPYKIMHLDHNVSFLAQFEGQGYQDIVGLATLTLLQSMMLSEENSLVSARSTVLGTAGTATAGTRAPSGSETQISGSAGTIWVTYEAANAFGVTAAGGTVSQVIAANTVVDVTLVDVTGAEYYNVYVASGAANPGRAASWFAGSTAWKKFTIQGALPTSGANPHTADTGTGASTNYDGLVSILSGSANSVYDPGSLGLNSGYTLRHNGGASGTSPFTEADLQTAFAAMWDKNKAEPSDIWTVANDRKALSDQIVANNSAVQAYRINVDPTGAGNLKVGAVVTSIYNESTGGNVDLTVHPWLHQGNMLLMSYQLPMPFAEVPNCWEVVNVQDMLSIAWPVIDARFRYSIYQYGALVGYAPQFSGIIQGIPKNASGTFS